MEHYLIPRKPALVFTVAVLALAFVNMTGIVTAEMMAGAIPVFCPFEALTGVPCPGCGMTRAMLKLVAGDIGGAAAHNPFCFFLVFTIAVSILPTRWLAKTPLAVKKLLPYFYISVLVLVIVFWVIDRLLPALC